MKFRVQKIGPAKRGNLHLFALGPTWEPETIENTALVALETTNPEVIELLSYASEISIEVTKAGIADA